MLQLGSTVLVNATFSWLVGAWFARRWLRMAGADADRFEPALRRLDLAAATLGVLGGSAALLAATATMSGLELEQASPLYWMMVSSTSFGHAGAIAVMAMAALFSIRLAGGAGRASDIGALSALIVFVVSRAAMSHAGESGLWTMRIAIEVIHLMAAGLWTGAVLVSGCVVLGASRTASQDLRIMGHYLDSMSQGATVAVAAIAATGVYNGWHSIGAPENLGHTLYGGTLLVKVALVLTAVALGGYNKFYGLSAARLSGAGVTLVRAVLQVEGLVLVTVLFVAALLTAQAPPAAG
nr:CopD family protein [uncultured Duganella sp.]